MTRGDDTLLRVKDERVGGDISLLLNPICLDDDIRPYLQEEEELLQDDSCIKLPTVPSTTVIRCGTPPACLYFKFFPEETGLRAIRSLWRGSKALRAWKGANLLLSTGFKTHQVLAVREGRGLNRAGRSLIVTRHVEGISLRSLLRQGDLTARELKRLSVHLGKEIGRLHNERIVHGDLHPGNIFVQLGEGDSILFYFLDTEKVTKARGKMLGCFEQDLSLLNHPDLGAITPWIRLRFFSAYKKANTHIEEKERKFLQKIKKKSTERYTKKRKKHGLKTK